MLSRVHLFQLIAAFRSTGLFRHDEQIDFTSVRILPFSCMRAIRPGVCTQVGQNIQ